MGFLSSLGNAYIKQHKAGLKKEVVNWKNQGNTAKMKKLFEDLAKQKGIKFG